MLYYVSQAGHSYTCAVVLRHYGEALRPVFRYVPYHRAESLRRAGAGTVIWTDLDRLSAGERAAAAALRSELRETRDDLVHLNDPLRSEQRFDLLRRLKAEGLNSFAVRRPGESLEGLHYPVFLRDEEGAAFTAPALLHDRAALEAAIAGLPASGYARPMIVEFCAEPGPDGCYRKYGAYRVGSRIYPQHCLVRSDWFIKQGAPMGPQHRAQHLRYLAANPHEAALRLVFDAARIEYGRIDYTLRGGRIEVFEINTNPAVLGHPPSWPGGLLDAYDQAPYARRHVEALLALPGAGLRAEDDEIDRRHARRMAEQARSLRRERAGLTWRALRQHARALLRGSTAG